MNTNYYNNASAAARSVFVILFGTLMSVCGDGLDFSLTSGSPKVPSPFSAADDIEALGASVQIPAASLGGSSASSDVNGLSYGQSEAADITTSPYYYKRLAYSVKHGATGNGSAPVTTEVAVDGAAGDTFALDFVGYGTKRYILRSPFTLVKAQTRSLTVQSSLPSDPEDDIDALALHRNSEFPVYVTFAPGGTYDANAIYIITAPGGPPQVFASATDLGLVAGDVIDGISIGTIPFGSPPPTTLNPNVVIWLTLAAGSPSRGAADSILQAWPAPGGVVLTADSVKSCRRGRDRRHRRAGSRRIQTPRTRC